MFKIFSSAAFCITAFPMSAALQIHGPGSSKEKQPRRDTKEEQRKKNLEQQRKEAVEAQQKNSAYWDYIYSQH